MKKLIFFICLISLLILSTCSHSAPNAVIKQTKISYQQPSFGDIQSVSLTSDSAGMVWMVPDNSAKITEQVINWLEKSKPVSVKLPKLKTNKEWISHGYTGPAILYLNLKNKSTVTISPAYYLWTSSNRKSLEYHYLENIIKYKFNGTTLYFNSPLLYEWLKNDDWKSQFKDKTD